MGLWSFLRKKRQRQLILTSVDGDSSSYLKSALDEAAKRPLDDLTFRIVTAYPHTRFVVDVSLFRLDSAFSSYERTGIAESRTRAGELLALSVQEKRPPEEIFGFVALAFFDQEFTVGANKGKTNATAWNTLTLDVEVTADQIRVNRGARRIEYPAGPIDLSFPKGGLFGR